MLTIGIAGGTGSGKTTVVRQIMEKLPPKELAIISQDSYYKDIGHLSYEERVKVNFDHPQSLDFDLMAKHIDMLKQGIPIQQPIYSFEDHNRTGHFVTVVPSKVLIVEGILIFTRSDIRSLFDIKIYVHADSDERLVRRLRRDVSERGRDVEEVIGRYQNTLKPMHEQFIEPTKEFADIIIPNNHYNLIAIDILGTIITQKLGITWDGLDA